MAFTGALLPPHRLPASGEPEADPPLPQVTASSRARTSLRSLKMPRRARPRHGRRRQVRAAFPSPFLALASENTLTQSTYSATAQLLRPHRPPHLAPCLSLDAPDLLQLAPRRLALGRTRRRLSQAPSVRHAHQRRRRLPVGDCRRGLRRARPALPLLIDLVLPARQLPPRPGHLHGPQRARLCADERARPRELCARRAGGRPRRRDELARLVGADRGGAGGGRGREG